VSTAATSVKGRQSVEAAEAAWMQMMATARARQAADSERFTAAVEAMRRGAAERERLQMERAATRSGMSAFARLEATLRAKSGDRGPVPATGAAPAAKLLSPPDEPQPGECCGNSCPLCVWTVYWERLQAWEKQERG